MSLRAWFFVWTVLGLGVALGGWAALNFDLSKAAWLTLVVLTSLATVAQLLEVEGPDRQSYYPHFVFFFAGVLLLPPFLYLLMIAIPHALELVKKRLTNSPLLRAWYIQPFNLATFWLAGLAANQLYLLLQNNTTVFSSPARVLVLSFLAFIYVLINHLLIGLVLFLARGISLQASKVLAPSSLLPDLIMACLGYLMAVMWQLDPWLILPALAILALMYEALKVPQLKQEAQTDVKTGLLNARYLDKALKIELERATRFKRTMSLIVADLDLMRNINNTYGHIAGDAVLTGIGSIIQANIREYDSAGRFGGEEFVIILPEASADEAHFLAERLRRAIANADFTVPNSTKTIKATMSMGVATFPTDGSTTTELMQAADEAVYQAKQKGRNCVVSSEGFNLNNKQKFNQLDQTGSMLDQAV